MYQNRIKVGFIGLNPDSHWAARAHIPALKSLENDFEVTGVANSTWESAKATAGDIRNNTRNAPTFRSSVALNELLNVLENSSKNKM